MQVGYVEQFFAQVYARHLRTHAEQTFGKYATATSYIDNAPTLNLGIGMDELQPQGVDPMQGHELAVRIPPASCLGTKFVNFVLMDVFGACHSLLISG